MLLGWDARAPTPEAKPKAKLIGDEAYEISTEDLRLMGLDAHHPFAVGSPFWAIADEERRFAISKTPQKNLNLTVVFLLQRKLAI